MATFSEALEAVIPPPGGTFGGCVKKKCRECSHIKYLDQAWIICSKTSPPREILNSREIPKWCPLEDA